MAERAAGKELLLEMGGNGPLVVLDDADLERAVEATLTACYLNAGQSCTAGERILVQEAVHEAFVAKLADAVRARVRLGDPSTTPPRWGPSTTSPSPRRPNATSGTCSTAGRGPWWAAGARS